LFSNPKWQRFALLLNLAGTALLFYSFQATSSDFRLVTARTPKGVFSQEEFVRYALCVNNFALIETDSANGVRIGRRGCPDWEHSRPAAVVNIEHPFFVGMGFVTLMAGFLIQYLSVPQPKTIADLRRELKLLKAKEKI
jgi:hypothetical protein